MIVELEGLEPCFSAAAALAGLLRGVREGMVQHDDTMLVSITGSNRKPSGASDTVHWLRRTEHGWEPEA